MSLLKHSIILQYIILFCVYSNPYKHGRGNYYYCLYNDIWKPELRVNVMLVHMTEGNRVKGLRENVFRRHLLSDVTEGSKMSEKE